jgi:type IV pilus assembly protein PilW
MAIDMQAQKLIFSGRGRIPSASAGFTLIELLVALAVGLFLLGGVISIFVSNQQNYKINENLSRIQENARFAVEQIGREVRDAGANPCGIRAVNNVVRRTPTQVHWWADWNSGTVVGYGSTTAVASPNGIAFGTAPGNRASGTDGIVVLRAVMDENMLRTVQSHNTTTAEILLSSASGYADRDLAFICDNSSGAIFLLNGNPNSNTISHAVSGGGNSSNCSSSLGWSPSVNCNSGAVTKQFAPGSFVTRYDPAFWFIGVGSAGGNTRSLYRATFGKTGSTGSLNATMQRLEILPDVEDMRIDYLTRQNPSGGVGLTTTASVLATTWVDADDAKFSTANNEWTSNNINEVIAVRITLTYRSSEQTVSSINSQVQLGEAADGSARRIERKTVSVINLRNRDIRP